MMRIGIAADHGGFSLKTTLATELRAAGYDVVDFGAHTQDPSDDYPDLIVLLAKAVAMGFVERGIGLCGNGIGASIAASKVAGARAGVIHDVFSAHLGVEDDDMNIACFGGKVIGAPLASDLMWVFLAARFSGAARHRRRVEKVRALESVTLLS